MGKCEKLWARLYKQETGFHLNYLTLQVADPILKEAINGYRNFQFKRVQYALLILNILTLLNTVL